MGAGWVTRKWNKSMAFPGGLESLEPLLEADSLFPEEQAYTQRSCWTVNLTSEPRLGSDWALDLQVLARLSHLTVLHIIAAYLALLQAASTGLICACEPWRCCDVLLRVITSQGGLPWANKLSLKNKMYSWYIYSFVFVFGSSLFTIVHYLLSIVSYQFLFPIIQL